MSDDLLCVVCREKSDKMKTCYHQINKEKRLCIIVCEDCFEETKDNWFYDPWKIMPETLEASSGALKLQSSDS